MPDVFNKWYYYNKYSLDYFVFDTFGLTNRDGNRATRVPPESPRVYDCRIQPGLGRSVRFDDVLLTRQSGERVELVGPTGAGKTDNLTGSGFRRGQAQAGFADNVSGVR